MNPQDPSPSRPLTANEVITCLRYRWGVTYDLQLLIREKRIYLQIMWGYLEQQSFPMNEEEYIMQLNHVLEIINRVGQAQFVRYWILNVQSKPRMGRALSLELKKDDRLEEFLL